MKHSWTKEEEQFLTENYPTLGRNDCARRLGLLPSVVKSKAKRMGLRFANRHYTTPEEREYVRVHYPTTPTPEVAAALGLSINHIYKIVEELGIHKSREVISAVAKKRFEQIGLARHSFQKGHEPFCKGKQQSEWMSAEGIERTKATRFKSGHKPANYRPVGSERVNIYGYIEVKVQEGMYGWRQKHREVWQAAHGPIPTGYNVMFKDGNKQNCTLDNLYLASNAEKMKHNTIHNYPKELKEVMMLKGYVKREINKQKRMKDERS